MAAPLTEFHLFPQLPPELRMEIWERHFESISLPRIHCITEVPGRKCPGPEELRPDYEPGNECECESCERPIHLEVITVTPSCDGPIHGRQTQITPECEYVAKYSRRKPIAREKVQLSRDIAEDTCCHVHSRDDITPTTLTPWAWMLPFWRPRVQPPPFESTYVNWDVDLIYIHVQDRPEPWSYLQHHEWAVKIQRLAIVVHELTLEEMWRRNVTSMFFAHFASLRELTLVFDSPEICGRLAKEEPDDDGLVLFDMPSPLRLKNNRPGSVYAYVRIIYEALVVALGDEIEVRSAMASDSLYRHLHRPVTNGRALGPAYP